MNKKTVMDFVKKYLTIMKYGLSAGASAIIDLLLFYLALYAFEWLGPGTTDNSEWIVVAATVFARVLSSLFNYSVNRNVVFQSASRNSFVKYYILCIVQMMASAGLVAFFTSLFPTGKFGKLVIKLMVDTCLFFLSFCIQREWVFKNKKQEVGKESRIQ